MADKLRRRVLSYTEIPQELPGIAPEIAQLLRFAFLPACGAVNVAGGPTDLSIALQQSAVFSQTLSTSGHLWQGQRRAEFTAHPGLSGTKGVTLIGVWRANATGYTNPEGQSYLLSTRTSGNNGWSWGKDSAASGGSYGNVTRQFFTLQGIAQYVEANSLIDSQLDTPVAVVYDPVAGKVSWYRFGQKSSADTTASTSPTAGGNIVLGTYGDYAAAGPAWPHQTSAVLAFEGVHHDLAAQLTQDETAIGLAFTRRVWVPAGLAAATGDGAGAASGICTVAGVGAALAAAAGSSAGTSTVAGVGASTAAAVGASTGSAGVGGVGAATAAAAGSAAGSSAVDGVGTSQTGSAGSSGGTGTVGGVGASIAAGGGAAAGIATVAAVGASTADAVGSAAGTSTVEGVGQQGGNVGTCSGTSTCSGVGAAIFSAVGTAAGQATVEGVAAAAPSTGFQPGYRGNPRDLRDPLLDQVREKWDAIEKAAAQLQRRRDDDAEPTPTLAPSPVPIPPAAPAVIEAVAPGQAAAALAGLDLPADAAATTEADALIARLLRRRSEEMALLLLLVEVM